MFLCFHLCQNQIDCWLLFIRTRDEKVNAITAYPPLHALHHSHRSGLLKLGGPGGRRRNGVHRSICVLIGSPWPLRSLLSHPVAAESKDEPRDFQTSMLQKGGLFFIWFWTFQPYFSGWPWISCLNLQPLILASLKLEKTYFPGQVNYDIFTLLYFHRNANTSDGDFCKHYTQLKKKKRHRGKSMEKILKLSIWWSKRTAVFHF